jgi:sugar lactone lactonase YvrE
MMTAITGVAMIEHLVAHPATAPDYDLAEAIVWDDVCRELGWVDIPRGRVTA